MLVYQEMGLKVSMPSLDAATISGLDYVSDGHGPKKYVMQHLN